MNNYFSRFITAITEAACVKCGKEFSVSHPSLLRKIFPHNDVHYCPFCGEGIDWEAIQQAPSIPIGEMK